MRYTSFLLCVLLLLTCSSQAKTIFTSDNIIAGVVASTAYSDSRYQAVYSRDELGYASGEITHVSVKIWTNTGFDLNHLTVRCSSISGSLVAAMEAGQFYNLGTLQTLFEGDVNINGIRLDNEWLVITVPDSLSAYLHIDNHFVLDFCVNGSEAGPGNTYFRCTTDGDMPALYAQAGSTDPAFNLLDATTGTLVNYRPIVRLDGPSFNVSGVLYPGQLPPSMPADMLVLENQSLNVFPGTVFDFGPEVGLVVKGSLHAVGNEEALIVFTGTDWAGVQVWPDLEEAESHIEHALIERVWTAGGDARAGLSVFSTISNVTVRNVEISQCRGKMAGGLEGLACFEQTVFEDIYIHDCTSKNQGGGIMLYNCDSRNSRIRIMNCTSSTGSGNGAYMTGCGTGLDRSILSNNGGIQLFIVGYPDLQFTNCTFHGASGHAWPIFIQDYYIAIPNTILFENCLFLATSDTTGLVNSRTHLPVFSHCASRGGTADFTGSEVAPILLEGNIVFRGLYDMVKWRPSTYDSPLVDAGRPGTYDPDLSRSDIGAGYWDKRSPWIYDLVDVPADQGHQLQLTWRASSMDLAQSHAAWFYSVWRLDSLFEETRSQECVWLSDVSQLDPQRLGDTPVRVITPEGRVWTFVEQVPATQWEEYGLVVPTLHDMLGGVPWESEVLVYWHYDGALAASNQTGAISEDNIAPDAPLALAASVSGDTMQMSWNEVSTGTLDGVTLPERNGIVYHIYASEEAWFALEDAEYLGSSDTPSFSIPVSENSRRFFKVVADDGTSARSAR